MTVRGATGINAFQLKDGAIKELDHILGSKVKVKDIIGQVHRGELQFVGTNELFPSWGLHCTVSRVPAIMINSVNDITLLDE